MGETGLYAESLARRVFPAIVDRGELKVYTVHFLGFPLCSGGDEVRWW